MKKIRFLNFQMDFLQPYEVLCFRGAMLHAIDEAPDLFHQHSTTGEIFKLFFTQHKEVSGVLNRMIFKYNLVNVDKQFKNPCNEAIELY